MGGSSQTQTSTQRNQSSVDPFQPAKPLLKNILSTVGGITPTNLSGAIPGLVQSGTSLASGQLPPDLLASIENSVRNTVGDQFAQAGRSFSGDFVNAMTKQLVNSEAPYAFQGMQLAPGLLSAASSLPFAGQAQKENLVLPIASAFPQNSGSSYGTSTLTQQANPWQTAAGVGLGLAGLALTPMTGGLSAGLSSTLAGSLLGGGGAGLLGGL